MEGALTYWFAPASAHCDLENAVNRTLLLSMLLLVACGASDKTSRDQVEVANDGLTPRAAVRVDTLRDETGEVFSSSYITFALTSVGGVVAIDQDEKRVLRFDSAGRQQNVAGRNGDGPGEFRFPTKVFMLGRDSVAVWDPGLRRMSLFADSLKFVRAITFPRWDFKGGRVEPVGRLSDGRWVALRIGRAPSPGPDASSRLSVDTLTLIAGRSDDVPGEFAKVLRRTGVDVLAGSSGGFAQVYILRLYELNVGVGQICERGAVLVDSGGVRIIGQSGRLARSFPGPRAGTPIQSSAERKAIVEGAMWGPIRSASNASTTRGLLATLVNGFSQIMRRPTLDVHGQLWYPRVNDPRGEPTAGLPSWSAENVDSVGRTVSAVTTSLWGTSAQIGRTTIAMLDYGSDTTGLSLRMYHFAESLLPSVEGPLGRCFSSFDY